MAYQAHINGLRGIAILLIVLYHYGVPGFERAFIGVDVFFVLSGYLTFAIVMQSQAVGAFSLKEFYLARIRRIVPAVTVVVNAVMAWAFVTQNGTRLVEIYHQASSALLYTSNFKFLSDKGYFDSSAFTKPLLHTWSLSVEMQYYLVLPLLLALPFCARRRMLLVGALFAGSLLWSIYYTPKHPEASYYLLQTRMWEFLAGCLAAAFSPVKYSARAQECLAWAGVMLLALGVLYLVDPYAHPGWGAIAPIAGSASLVLFGARGLMGQLLSTRPLQYAGTISYSLYLWHWPLLVIALFHFGRPLQVHELSMVFAVTLLCSFASYRWVELPVRYNKLLWTNRRVLGIVFFTLLLAVSCHYAAKATDGFLFRYPEYISRTDATYWRPPERQKECFRDSDGKHKANEEFCAMGSDEESTSVLLWGDSQANHLHTALSGLLRSLHLKGHVATSGGCPPNAGNENESSYADPEIARMYPTCQRFNKRVLQHMNDTPGIRYVIMAANWERYKPELIIPQIKDISCTLAKEGKRVILVGAVPVLPFHVLDRWQDIQLSARKPVENVTVPRTDYAARFAAFDAIQKEIAQACGNVTAIYPEDAYCDSRVCYGVRNGEALYVDTAHLTVEGAGFLMPALRQALTSAH